MAAPKGNQFWKARTKHGRDKLFESAELLWEACCEYFDWVEANPLWEDKVSFYQGVPTHEKVEKMRAMTLDGLCFFLRINDQTWRNWKKDDDFLGVITEAENVIRSQKFAGAAADLLNANIISRDLGLSDKSEVKQTSTISVSADMSPQDAARAYQDLMGNGE